jgi:DNA invertase Pin-like site-specific DNA recombinase
MLADARQGKLRQLFVFKLDRLSRGGIRSTLTLLEELRGAGVAVESVSDGFSLTGPYSDVVVAVIAWAAQMERAAIGDRIYAARQRALASETPWGRPRRLDDLAAARCRRLKKDGRSIREISIALKIPKSTVARAVSQKPKQIDGSRTPEKQATRPLAATRPK